jgi:hypothetical protein
MKPRTFLLLTGFLLHPLIDWARADESALKKRVLLEYPLALKNLETHYGRATGTAKHSAKSYNGELESVLSVGAYSFALDRPKRAKLMIKSSGGTKRREESARRVICYNEEYSFELASKGSAELSIKSLEKGSDLGVKQMQGELSRSLEAPLRMYILPVAGVFESPNFKIRSATEISRKSKRMIKIEFDSPSDNHRGGYEGFLVVSPEERWTLYEYEYRAKKGTGLRKGTIEYEGTDDGFPIPKQIIHSTFKLPQLDLRHVETVDLQDIRFTVGADREFTLAAFGFPEMLQPSRAARTGNTGPWLIGLALFSLCIAVALKFASTYFRRTAGTVA